MLVCFLQIWIVQICIVHERIPDKRQEFPASMQVVEMDRYQPVRISNEEG